MEYKEGSMSMLVNLLSKIGIHVSPKKKFTDMSPQQFLLLLTYLFNAMDYIVKQVGKTNAYGGDLIIHKENDLVVAQLKYNRAAPIGANDISEAILAQKYYGCIKTMIVTTLIITKEAVNVAEVNNVELVGKQQLRDWLKKYLNERWN